MILIPFEIILSYMNIINYSNTDILQSSFSLVEYPLYMKFLGAGKPGRPATLGSYDSTLMETLNRQILQNYPFPYQQKGTLLKKMFCLYLRNNYIYYFLNGLPFITKQSRKKQYFKQLIYFGNGTWLYLEIILVYYKSLSNSNRRVNDYNGAYFYSN